MFEQTNCPKNTSNIKNTTCRKQTHHIGVNISIIAINYKPYFPTVNTDCLFKSDKNVDITNNALFYKRIYIW